MGVLGPFIWTIKAYYLKIVLTSRSSLTIIDLAIDQYLITSTVLSILCIVYHAHRDIPQEELL